MLPFENSPANVQREADRVALNRYAPTGVLINADCQVLQFRGDTSAYLKPPSGHATFNVLKMAREGLMLPLRAAVNQAKKENKVVRRENVRVQQTGKMCEVNFEVVPLKNLKEHCYLIFFEEGSDGVRGAHAPRVPVEAPRLDDRGRRTSDASRKSKRPVGEAPTGTREARVLPKEQSRRIAELERELSDTRDYLQSIQEQYEAANEELQAANEEVTSANEELQSTNEELETSKEELESTNEELTTVNEEMIRRNADLGHLNDDLVNFQGAANLTILLVGSDLTIHRYSGRAARQFNLLPADVGRPITGIQHNLDVPDLEEIIADVTATMQEREREVRDKSGHWYSLRVRPYLTKERKVEGAVLVLHDIDVLKRNAEEITQAREYAEAIVRTGRDMVLVLNADLRVHSANDAFYKAFQTSAKETEGRLIYDLGNGQWNIPKLRTLLEEIIPRNTFFADYEVAHEFERIGRSTMLLNARMLTDPTGAPRRILLGIHDITERLEAEAKFRRSELRYRRLFESAKDGVLILDGVTAKITDSNPFMTELLGYSREEFLDKELCDIDLIKDRGECERVVKQLQAGQIVRYDDLPLKTKSGQALDVEMVANLYHENGHEVIQCNIRDITERKRSRVALHESEERFRRLLQDLTDYAVLALDTEGKICSWNEGAERILGYRAEEILGQHFSRLFVEEEAAEGRPAWVLRTAATQGRAETEHWLRRKDGSRFWASGITSRRRDDTGTPVGFVKVLRDLTRRKEMEEALHDAREQLLRQNAELEREVEERTARLQEMVGELEAVSYSIAHDMRAPLRTMMSFARLVQTEHADQLNETARHYLERIVTGSQRLDRLVIDVLTYSRVRRERLSLHPVNVDKLIEEAINTQPEFQSPSAEIEIQRPMHRVMGNEAALMQCVNNLLSNAVKFVLPDTVPRVRVWSEEINGDVRLWFEDNGIGIALEDRERIFSLFARLNPASQFEGTGVGLTIVRKAVERMSGRVGVESEPGRGSRFWIQLKKAKDA